MKNFLCEDLENSLIVELEISIKTTWWAPELAQASHTQTDKQTSTEQIVCTY